MTGGVGCVGVLADAPHLRGAVEWRVKETWGAGGAFAVKNDGQRAVRVGGGAA